MSTAGDLSDPAIEAVRNPTAAVIAMLLRAGEGNPLVYIAAMFDNLPRAEMEEKICMSVMSCDMGCEQSAEKRLCRRSVDAVIAAARETLLRGGRSKGKS